jgi:hypothetical protein
MFHFAGNSMLSDLDTHRRQYDGFLVLAIFSVHDHNCLQVEEQFSQRPLNVFIRILDDSRPVHAGAVCFGWMISSQWRGTSEFAHPTKLECGIGARRRPCCLGS